MTASANQDATPRLRRGPWWRRLLYFVAIALVAFYVTTCVRIIHQSKHDEARPSDAIVVFGAAEYAGRPSPVFRARLDHAYDLYERKLAPMVIVSGGSGGDPTFNEGGVGRDYLASKGIGDLHLIAETQADNTSESASRVAVIMRKNGWTKCIAVSDAYHLFRIKQMMARQGIETYTSPRPQEAPLTKFSRVLTIMREGLSYLLWTLHIT
jgi:uncharacterized SAM-binding protein YcdF (DUF218 family)